MQKLSFFVEQFSNMKKFRIFFKIKTTAKLNLGQVPTKMYTSENKLVQVHNNQYREYTLKVLQLDVTNL